MRMQKLSVAVLALLVCVMATAGCKEAVRDGVTIGVTEGLSEGIATLVADLIGSFSRAGE